MVQELGMLSGNWLNPLEIRSCSNLINCYLRAKFKFEEVF